MTDAIERSLIATFASTDMAEQAAKDLLGWAGASEDIKLGAIGLISKDASGEVNTRNLSERHTQAGARIGMAIGFVAAVISGGLTLVPTALGGAAAGAVAGNLAHKRLRVAEPELNELGNELTGGRAALL